MGTVERMAADLWATGVTPDGYPTELVRSRLDELGVMTAAGLIGIEHGTRVWAGGIVTHRQRPATAGGTTFVNLEDETGLVNVISERPEFFQLKFRSSASQSFDWLSELSRSA